MYLGVYPTDKLIDLLVLHQDNGSPMKASTFVAKLDQLGIRRSYSRPGVSDDNAYSEMLEKNKVVS